MNYIYRDVVPNKVTFWAIGGLDFYIWIMGGHTLTCNNVSQKTLNTIETSKFIRDTLKSKWENVWQSDDGMNTASFLFFPFHAFFFHYFANPMVYPLKFRFAFPTPNESNKPTLQLCKWTDTTV